MDLEAVAAFGCEVDVFWPGEELFFFVFAEDAACVLGDDLDTLEGGAFAAGVGADEADVGPEGAAGAALVAVEDEPHGPLPGVVVEADFLDVTLGKGACGFVALGGVVGDGDFFGLHCDLFICVASLRDAFPAVWVSRHCAFGLYRVMQGLTPFGVIH